MTIFASVEAARKHGFQWVEYRPDLELHVVLRDYARADGQRVRALAFARPER